MEDLLEELIDVLLDAQDALEEQAEIVWIDGFGYPVIEEVE